MRQGWAERAGRYWPTDIATFRRSDRRRNRNITGIRGDIMDQKEMMRVGKQLLRHAKSAGATDAVVSVDTSTERSVTVRDGVLDDVAFSSSAGFMVTAIVGNRRGYASSSSFENDDLARTAKEAVLSALQVSGNKHVRLARPDEWPCGVEELPGRIAQLDRCDGSLPPTLKELKMRALALDRCACAFPGIARSEGSSLVRVLSKRKRCQCSSINEFLRDCWVRSLVPLVANVSTRKRHFCLIISDHVFSVMTCASSSSRICRVD